ncbi:MAG: hypothetical protein M1818_000339 [Claussenomyces sp. TS43310]|nr:MAG: hypothetical protein M1818_000339 [Claussenomyces sp. TS43310]
MAEEASPPRGGGVSPVPGLRRVLTAEESAPLRPRPPATRISSPGRRRRSSNLSDFSLNEARKQFQSSTDDILLPKPGGTGQHGIEPSPWHSAPLAFALLPALGGMLFQNGSAVVTDIMILGLAAIFLNWSVRLPWNWYQSAQEIRLNEEYNGDTIVDEESGDENDLEVSQASLDDVPEDAPAPTADTKRIRRPPAHESASNELYAHEVLALLSCFLFPILGAYLLHSIRSSLSRPSEGLVSNYNLTVFLLASELRPMAHLVKLMQARTLHLQRLVHANPYDSVQGQPTNNTDQLLKRLEELEARTSSAGPGFLHATSETPLNGKQITMITVEVRRTLQPELDSLNRAVRRYEKRLATQTMQTESRLLGLESRLADAISLAAAAAQVGQRHRHTLSSIMLEWMAAAVVLPLQALGTLASLPFKTVVALVGYGKAALTSRGPSDQGRRTTSVKHSSHNRIGIDRLQGKMFKR